MQNEINLIHTAESTAENLKKKETKVLEFFFFLMLWLDLEQTLSYA